MRTRWSVWSVWRRRPGWLGWLGFGSFVPRRDPLEFTESEARMYADRWNLQQATDRYEARVLRRG